MSLTRSQTFVLRKNHVKASLFYRSPTQIGIAARRCFQSTVARSHNRNSTPFRPSKYSTSLLNSTSIYDSHLGSIRQVTSSELPTLENSNLSLQRLTLAPKSIRAPNWTVNAATITYCIKGKLLVSILDTKDVFAAFTVEPGQMFSVPSGSIYYIENVGAEPAELITCFRHPQPQEFSFWAAMGAMTPAVLGNTFSEPASAFSKIHFDTKPQYIIQRAKGGDSDIPSTAALPDPHKLDIEAQSPPIDLPYGAVKLARAQFWPALQEVNLAMYSLRIAASGMREAHWHPETTEMGYVASGQARMSILSPDGEVVTYYLQQGDCYIVPVAYPHQIEDLGEGGFKFLVFFDQATPKDIGYRKTGSAFSRVMPAVLGVEPGAGPAFPPTPIDPLIVKKINPTDPVK